MIGQSDLSGPPSGTSAFAAPPKDAKTQAAQTAPEGEAAVETEFSALVEAPAAIIPADAEVQPPIEVPAEAAVDPEPELETEAAETAALITPAPKVESDPDAPAAQNLAEAPRPVPAPAAQRPAQDAPVETAQPPPPTAAPLPRAPAATVADDPAEPAPPRASAATTFTPPKEASPLISAASAPLPQLVSRPPTSYAETAPPVFEEPAIVTTTVAPERLGLLAPKPSISSTVELVRGPVVPTLTAGSADQPKTRILLDTAPNVVAEPTRVETAALRVEATSSPTSATSSTAPAQGPATSLAAAKAIGAQLAAAMSANGPGKLEVRLDPPELGRVTLTFLFTEDGVAAAVAADRPETADLMRRHGAELTRELEDAGFSDVMLDFDDQQGTQEQTFSSEESLTSPVADPPASGTEARSAETAGMSARLDIRI